MLRNRPSQLAVDQQLIVVAVATVLPTSLGRSTVRRICNRNCWCAATSCCSAACGNRAGSVSGKLRTGGNSIPTRRAFCATRSHGKSGETRRPSGGQPRSSLGSAVINELPSRGDRSGRSRFEANQTDVYLITSLESKSDLSCAHQLQRLITHPEKRTEILTRGRADMFGFNSNLQKQRKKLVCL